jgi:hypothetical protein
VVVMVVDGPNVVIGTNGDSHEIWTAVEMVCVLAEKHFETGS